jgi:DNA-directed RNA polymerase beta' subunit
LLNLGDRPEKLIITEISVPPVPIRPSVFVGGGRMRFVLWFLENSYNGVLA